MDLEILAHLDTLALISCASICCQTPIRAGTPATDSCGPRLGMACCLYLVGSRRHQAVIMSGHHAALCAHHGYLIYLNSERSLARPAS